jgi:hypothetical protein
MPDQALENNIEGIEAQSCINNLINRALKDAIEHWDQILFDPQGRFLIDLLVTEQEKAACHKNFGIKATDKITLSLDVYDTPILYEAFKQQYDLSDEESKQLRPIQRSLFPLQQELYFHLRRSSRVYLRMEHEFGFVDNVTPEQMEVALACAMVEVTERVVSCFQQIIKKAIKNNEWTRAFFIKQCELVREALALEAHQRLLHEIEAIEGQTLTPELQKITTAELEEITQKLPATSKDVLHRDLSLGLVTWISGSKMSMNNQDFGTQHLAARRIITIPLNRKTKYRNLFRVLVPLLRKKSQQSKNLRIEEMHDNLIYLNKRYHLSHIICETVINTRSFSYYVTEASHESHDISLMIQGAHAHNALELAEERLFHTPAVLCFVQYLPVTDTHATTLKKEAILMSHLSFLNHLTDEDEDSEINKHIQKIFRIYKVFLLRKNREMYFSESHEGQSVIKGIGLLKKLWIKKNHKSDWRIHDYLLDAKYALSRMIAYNLHYFQEFSKLIQSLSIFISEVSMSEYGGPSGVQDRVAILESQRQFLYSELVKIIAMLAVAEDKKAVVTLSRLLNKKLEQKCAIHAQGATALISLVDEGLAYFLDEEFVRKTNNNRLLSQIKRIIGWFFHKNKAAHKAIANKVKKASYYAKPVKQANQNRQYSMSQTKVISELNNMLEGILDEIDQRKNRVLYTILKFVLFEIRDSIDEITARKIIGDINSCYDLADADTKEQLNKLKSYLIQL